MRYYDWEFAPLHNADNTIRFASSRQPPTTPDTTFLSFLWFTCAMSEPDMKIDPTRAKALASQLQQVKERIGAVASSRQVDRFLVIQRPSY